MKKLLVFGFVMFICTLANAHTIEWYVDNTPYQTTTCSSGDNINQPTPPAKYGYTFRRWGHRYIELEYIESTGTQYIDTGLVVPTNYKWELRLNTRGSNTAPYWGYANNNVYYNATSFYSLGANGTSGINGTALTIGVYSGTAESSQSSFYNATVITNADTLGGDTVHTIKCEGNFVFTADGTSMTQVVTKTFGAFTPNGTAYLFARNVPTMDAQMIAKAGVRIYSYKVWNANDVLVQDMIPAQDNDGSVGFYDTVSDSFFTNAGTGEFIAGPEIGDL